MIKRPRVSSIWSEDLNNLLPFYRDVLGLKVEMETPGFAILGNPDEPVAALGTHSEIRGIAIDPFRHIVGFESDDVQGDCVRLKSAGVNSSKKRTSRERVDRDAQGSGGQSRPASTV